MIGIVSVNPYEQLHGVTLTLNLFYEEINKKINKDKKLNSSSQVTQPVSGRAEIGTQMIWLQGWAFKLYILCLQWFLLALLLLLSHFSHVWLCATPQTAAHQARPSLAFSRQKHWSGLPFPSPRHESEKWKWSHSVVSDSSRPHGLQPTRLLHPWDFPGKSTGVGCHCLLAQSTPKPKKKYYIFKSWNNFLYIIYHLWVGIICLLILTLPLWLFYLGPALLPDNICGWAP